VTDEEIASFREMGWVCLRGLVEPEFAADLLQRAKATTPVSAATDNRGASNYEGAADKSTVPGIFSDHRYISDDDDAFHALAHSPAMARNASRMMMGDKSIRLFLDNVLVKESARSGAGHRETIFHQDFASYPLDRSAVIDFWLALTGLTSDMGTLRFYNRSHQYGTLGRSYIREGDAVTNLQPWLDELELSAPIELAAGDATVHNSLVVHGASTNTGDGQRWAYSMSYFDADALYTGSPLSFFDGLDLVINEPLDNPRFPVVPF
jgi:ectoine hydroxylase-related dioxygenase (phytanoyl-CoA dioxygenase family)